MTRTAAAEPTPIPIAWLVLMALCVVDREPDGLVGDEIDNVAVSEAPSVTEAEGEVY